MDKIYKYKLEHFNFQVVRLPKGAQILCVQIQNETPCIWARVDSSEKDYEERTFEIYGTGHEVRDEEDKYRDYIGTYKVESGFLLFHLFEVCEFDF